MQTLASTITIVKAEGQGDLYYRRQGASSPQPCYLYFDPEQRGVCASYSATELCCVPKAVWHRTLFMIPIPCLRADAVNALMEELAPRLALVADGYTWDVYGALRVGYLTDAAQDILAKITDEVAPKSLRWYDTEQLVDCWQADEWLGEGYEDELGIKADTKDEELEQIAKDICEDAHTSGVDVLEGLDVLLLQVREQKRSTK